MNDNFAEFVAPYLAQIAELLWRRFDSGMLGMVSVVIGNVGASERLVVVICG